MTHPILDSQALGADIMAQLRGDPQAGAGSAPLVGGDSNASSKKITQNSPSSGPSSELERLLVNYCASQTAAEELENVDWGLLARRLGTRAAFLKEAAEVGNGGGELWDKVIQERIKRALATKSFRDVTWERLESKALDTLFRLADRNLIRDPGELLAVASAARKINTNEGAGAGGGNHVSINLGVGDMSGNGELPASGARMTIDLSPRSAAALSGRTLPDRNPERVIDGEMIGAKELRDILEKGYESHVIDVATPTDEGE